MLLNWSMLLILLLSSLLSCKERNENQIKTDGLEAEGASNTRGVGATFPLEARVFAHLKANGIDVKKQLAGKKILFSVDYFFPTNFPAFNDSNISTEKIAELTNLELDKLSQRYDFLMIPTLLDRKDLNVVSRQRFAEKSFESLRFIESKLNETNLKTKKTEIINRTLREFAAKNLQKCVILEAHVFFDRMIAKNGLERPGMQWDISPQHLFASDLIHFTNHGQVAFFNYLLREKLAKLPEFSNVSIPEMPVYWKYDSDWRKGIIKLIAGTREDFSAGKLGDYWGRVPSVEPFYAKASKFYKGEGSAYKSGIEDLGGIQSTIGWLVYSGGAVVEHFVARGMHQGRRIITLDLAKTIFFTNIDLVESTTTPGTFVGYGYDYWSSVKNSPVTNYRFTVREISKTKLQVEWKLFPNLKDERGRKQEYQLERKELRDSYWIDYLEKNMDTIPSLTYLYEIDIVNE